MIAADAHPQLDSLVRPLGPQLLPQALGHLGGVVQLVHEPQQQALSRREGARLGIGRARAGDLLLREPGTLTEESHVHAPFVLHDSARGGLRSLGHPAVSRMLLKPRLGRVYDT